MRAAAAEEARKNPTPEMLAAERRQENISTFLASHPHLDPADRDAILAAPITVYVQSGQPLAPGVEMPYDPARYHWSAVEVYAASPEECRECCTARPHGSPQRHFGWALWQVCGRSRGGCDHAHHDDEVWYA